MSQLDQIKEPVKDHIVEFEKYFRSSMKSSVPLLDRITRYIVNRKGKQMRPLFVFLSAEIAGGVNESTYRGASLVELLHTATLQFVLGIATLLLAVPVFLGAAHQAVAMLLFTVALYLSHSLKNNG